jgi:hypothetical protein
MWGSVLEEFGSPELDYHVRPRLDLMSISRYKHFMGEKADVVPKSLFEFNSNFITRFHLIWNNGRKRFEWFFFLCLRGLDLSEFTPRKLVHFKISEDAQGERYDGEWSMFWLYSL